MLEKIKNTIKLTTDIYLEKHLPRIPEDKKQIAINAYEKDIERIASFVYNSGFLNKDFLLSEDFIKGLHKTFYPEGFTQKGIDENGKEIIWFIPGEYRKIKAFSKARQLAEYCSNIPGWDPQKNIYTDFENISIEMKKNVNKYNNNLNNGISLNEKKDFILFFIIDLLYIHPFSDGNGRLIKILCDLLLLQIGLKSIGFMKISKKNEFECDKSMYLSHDQRDLKYIYDFIKKYS
ncbi:MAG: Fic family protein [Candidatus Gracilibacteria bacterium]|nr:Fic family protein [Candidatus Gracilibacteria bacterium]